MELKTLIAALLAMATGSVGLIEPRIAPIVIEEPCRGATCSGPVIIVSTDRPTVSVNPESRSSVGNEAARDARPGAR